MKQLLYIIFLTLAGLPLAAQNRTAWDQGIINPLRRDGQIYIVIAVVAIILLGLFWYMWRLDKKITRLEQQIHK